MVTLNRMNVLVYGKLGGTERGSPWVRRVIFEREITSFCDPQGQKFLMPSPSEEHHWQHLDTCQNTYSQAPLQAY